MNTNEPEKPTIRKVRLGDSSSDRAEPWSSMTPEERVVETWKLTLELWRFKGWKVGEPGLRRPLKRAKLR